VTPSSSCDRKGLRVTKCALSRVVGLRLEGNLVLEATTRTGSDIFTVRLHVMQRTVFPRPFCPSICLSVRLSVKGVDYDKMKET